MPDPAVVASLRAVGAFKELDSARIERLAAVTSRRHFFAGEFVWRRGDLAHSFVVVEDGLIAIQRSTAEGESVLVALFGPRDALCVVPMLQHVPFPADAVVLSKEAEALLIAGAPVLQALARDRELSAALNRALLEDTLNLRNKIELVSAGTVPRRIAALLLWLGGRFGRAIGDAVEIHPALTREQIGQLVNARTETVIRIMSRWSKTGWITGNADTLTLVRLDMLRRMARDVVAAPACGR